MDEDRRKVEIVQRYGNVREVKYGNSDYEVIETGLPTTGGYAPPVTGRDVYLASRKSTGNKYSSVILRIYGKMNPSQNYALYNPAPGEEVRWMSQRVSRDEIERAFYEYRFGNGGTGDGEPARPGEEENKGDFPNQFLNEISTMSGWNWDEVYTVQFLSEPEEL